jgi:hypothetical protein
MPIKIIKDIKMHFLELPLIIGTDKYIIKRFLNDRKKRNKIMEK